MKYRNSRGSAIITALVVMLMVLMMGSALLSTSLQAQRRGHQDLLRIRALGLAEAGVDKAIYYLRGTAPDNSTDGSWRTAGTVLRETATWLGDYEMQVADGVNDNSGKIVITSEGLAWDGLKDIKRAIRVTLDLDLENVSIWNNVIFAGVGQGGRSINGNVAMRGSVHILGEGEPFTDVDGDGKWDSGESYTDTNGNSAYDLGEPYTDSDNDGHWDGQEPFNDINGNGTREAPLTVTDLASSISGSANMGNNYEGMSVELRGKLPALDTTSHLGENVESLDAKLRVKHGRVDISGSAAVGEPNVFGGINPLKETMDGTYVSDGFGGNQGSDHVYSDNGFSQRYNLGDAVSFPVISDPAIVGGVSYPSYMAYLSDIGLHIPGDLNLKIGTAYGPVSDGNGNSLSVDADGTIHIQGIVYIEGDLTIDRDGGDRRMYYDGRGTFVTEGSTFIHTDLMPLNAFPIQSVLGILARRRIELATGGGDSQLILAGAFYAQEEIRSAKQNEIAGTFVSSYFNMRNVPRMYQVPKLVDNLPPGLPGGDPIWVTQVRIDSWKEVATSP